MTTQYCKISLKHLSSEEAREGYKPAALKTLLGSTKVSPHLPFTRREFFQSSHTYAQGMSISGVQQKLSIRINEARQLVPTTENGEFILKPSPETFPCAAENEHAAMRLSVLLGFDTAQCGLVDFTDGELAYLTRRFDRQKGGEKIHQEDLLQCFDLPSEDKYSKTYEEAGRLIQRVTGGKQAVVLDFIKRVLFAYLTGNDDLHLKNISVQRHPGNTGLHYDKLTPNYDCLFCEAFNTGDASGLGQLALGLLHDRDDNGEYFSAAHGRYGYYTGIDFIELGNRLGIPDKPLLKFIASLEAKYADIIALVEHSFMPESMKKRTISLIQERLRAISILSVDD